MWSNNPVRDAEWFQAERDEKIKKLISCDHCGNVIGYGEDYFDIDGEIYCEDCLCELYRKTAYYD